MGHHQVHGALPLRVAGAGGEEDEDASAEASSPWHMDGWVGPPHPTHGEPQPQPQRAAPDFIRRPTHDYTRGPSMVQSRL